MACNGRLDGVDLDAVVRTVTIDSRRAGPGALFVALRGRHADGHDFVADALARGAVAALVAEDAVVEGSLVRTEDDPLQTLLRLAGVERARMLATVIAVTGSSGKTCTKDLIAAAVATERRTVASEASYNNEIGVPLTLLSTDETTEVLVVEVGSRGLRHIAMLAARIRPDVAVVTNVGPAHLGLFGSLEVTARAKAELVESLDDAGVAVLNADDPAVRAMAACAPGAVVTFGRAPDADVRAEDVSLDDGARASFTVVADAERARVVLRIPGEHMVANALAAVAAARAAGVSLAAAAAGVGDAKAAAWRMEVREIGGWRVLNDAYNANPDSMAAALKTLVAMARGGPSCAVLGYMAELGGAAAAEHDRIGRLAVRLGVGRVLVVGEEARPTLEAARLEGMPPDEAIFAGDPDAAVAMLHEWLEPGAVVLVKASRAAGLERVVELLEETA